MTKWVYSLNLTSSCPANDLGSVSGNTHHISTLLHLPGIYFYLFGENLWPIPYLEEAKRYPCPHSLLPFLAFRADHGLEHKLYLIHCT